MNNRQIPLSVPNLNMKIAENLRECIETGWVSTGGRFITEFEEKTAKYLKVSEAVSTQSGTAGLHLALQVLGVGEGDEVIVPTLTFVAAVNPVMYVGADPVFMDCDDSLCMDVAKLEQFLAEECEFIEEITLDIDSNSRVGSPSNLSKGSAKVTQNSILVNKNTGMQVKAILPVHIFGNMANMEAIMNLAKRYGLKVVEDATEALGSYVKKGKYAGKFAGTIGDIGVYSFNANKIITTGGGGMVVSNNKRLLDEVRHLSVTAKADSLYFIHDQVGYNYRMLNTQAALGVSQIDELEGFIETKVKNYKDYSARIKALKGLENMCVRLLPFNDVVRANHWFYSLLIERTEMVKKAKSNTESKRDKKAVTRDELMHSLIEKGIQCRPVWKLIHTLEPYKSYEAYMIEKATYYESHILNVPCSTSMTAEDVNYVCDEIQSILEAE